MTNFKFLGATLVLSALLATPASAWPAISEPANAEAADPTFSIYSGMGHGFSVLWPRSRHSATHRDGLCQYGRIAVITPPASSAIEHGLRIASPPD